LSALDGEGGGISNREIRISGLNEINELQSPKAAWAILLLSTPDKPRADGQQEQIESA
jgi:hypothetical protein